MLHFEITASLEDGDGRATDIVKRVNINTPQYNYEEDVDRTLAALKLDLLRAKELFVR